ncbi:hypothetical protein EKO27_g2984, partial [Xylaria grammica]
ADLNGDADLRFHDAKLASGTLGLATKSGTVCRMVDFGPDSTRLKRGDIAVQRATIHAWGNPSKTEWARMVFVLQDTKPLVVNGLRYGEDYGRGTEGVLPSGNDD